VFLKSYGGFASLDHVLVEVARYCRDSVDTGLGRRWFFIRYTDPDTHLRVRIQGDGSTSAQVLMSELSRIVARAVGRNQIWRFAFDTYQREVERYGGLEGIELSEQLFWADSDAVAEVVASVGTDLDTTQRLHIALLGVHALLEDFGVDLAARRDRLRLSATQLGLALGTTLATRRSFGERFRSQRASIESLLGDQANQTRRLVADAFARRSARIAQIAKSLNETARRGGLHNSVENLLSSYLHLHVNRVMRSNAQTSELIVYDFLCRVYDSQLGRAGGKR
jgi:thiopeptide-type bacteriocin biosynthesis protein